MDESTPDAIALWRYQVIASLLSLDATARGALHHAIKALSSRVFEHPKKGPINLGFGTIEEWYHAYKKENLEGLKLRRRSDRGKSRKIDDATAEKIEAIAVAHPTLDGKGTQKELAVALKDSGQDLPSLSTLYRFLKATGLDRRNVLRQADHRAYAFEFAGDCWQGDVMYGPTIVTKDGKRKKTYLIANLDDATRLIAHAEFYFDDDLRSLRDCVKQALLKRGCPKRFYFDNGEIFRSRMMLAVAAQLGIHLIDTKPYRPQGRAKLERFLGTVRRSFLKRIDLSKLDDLAAFNRLLFAFVEGEYHRSRHRGIAASRRRLLSIARCDFPTASARFRAMSISIDSSSKKPAVASRRTAPSAFSRSPSRPDLASSRRRSLSASIPSICGAPSSHLRTTSCSRSSPSTSAKTDTRDAIHLVICQSRIPMHPICAPSKTSPTARKTSIRHTTNPEMSRHEHSNPSITNQDRSKSPQLLRPQVAPLHQGPRS